VAKDKDVEFAAIDTVDVELSGQYRVWENTKLSFYADVLVELIYIGYSSSRLPEHFSASVRTRYTVLRSGMHTVVKSLLGGS
jgi:hypothetical protein